MCRGGVLRATGVGPLECCAPRASPRAMACPPWYPRPAGLIASGITEHRGFAYPRVAAGPGSAGEGRGGAHAAGVRGQQPQDHYHHIHMVGRLNRSYAASELNANTRGRSSRFT